MHTPRHRLPRFDPVDQHERHVLDVRLRLLPRDRLSIVENRTYFDRYVAGRGRSRVAHANVEKQRNFRRPCFAGRGNVDHGQIGTLALDALYELDLDAGVLELLQGRLDSRRLFPLPAAKVRDDIDDPVFIRGLFQQAREQPEDRTGTDRRRRDIQRVPKLFHLLRKLAVDRLGIEVGHSLAGIFACQSLRESQERQALRDRLFRG